MYDTDDEETRRPAALVTAKQGSG